MLQAGAHLVPVAADAVAANDAGHITSVAYSATLGCWIGLGLVAGGARRNGEIFRAVNPLQNTDVQVQIVPRVFHDPDGTSLHG